MPKSKRARDRSTDNLFKPRRYTRKTVYKDREYGVFWYAWLWRVVRPFLVFACSLLIVIGLASTAWDKLYTGYIAAPDANDAETPGFTIQSGQSITRIGANLYKENYIRSTALFKYYIQFYGLTNDIQSGVYYISRDMNLFEIVNAISSGNATNERTIRIIPGWTCEDIADYLVSAGAINNREQFLNACREHESYLGYSLALINADENADLKKRVYPLEGYLAPDTYRVYLTADSASIIRTLLRQTDAVYESLNLDKQYYDDLGNLIIPDDLPGVPLESDEAFILASMIEKEAASLENMRRVSAVFHNRLKSNMKLESDPTATYLTGNKKLALTAAETSVDTAYNTYRVNGLPLGPICNPSKNALYAAVHPDEDFINENYLYFCAAEPGTGEIAFAKTYDEHQRNVAQYRPLWEAYDREHAN